MNCPICLDIIKNDKFIMSCGHSLHYDCFVNFFMTKKCHIFVECPLCREINYNNERPYKTVEDNIKKYSITGRCMAQTKDGRRCKKKCVLMNNGLCHIHNKDTLPKDKWKYICDFIYYIIEAGNSLKTKIILLDIAKQIIIRDNLNDPFYKVQHYLFRYYHTNNILPKYASINGIYEYYNMKIPLDDWINKCIKNKKLL